MIAGEIGARLGGIEWHDQRSSSIGVAAMMACALAMAAARNLGGNPKNWNEGINWLITCANETTEEGVVDEINFLID